MKLLLSVAMAQSGRAQTRITRQLIPKDINVVEIRIAGGFSRSLGGRALAAVGEKLVASATFPFLKGSGEFWVVDGDAITAASPASTTDFPWLTGERHIRPILERGTRFGRDLADIVLRFGEEEWTGARATTWEAIWRPVAGSKRRGGQGTVTKVCRESDGVMGALKLLHEGADDGARRYRLHREAEALRFMSGEGTPAVLDANTAEYDRRGVPLYVVTRFIDGPTLAEHVNRRGKLGVDEATAITCRLAETLRRFHAVSSHRDIKPDNVILEKASSDTPVLVDFGMASALEGGDDGFETSADQELGNRFLRLPEFVAGRHNWDPRSDITFLVGLFFFMVTGRSPRALQDATGRAPHETLAEPLQAELGRDARWPRVLRIFSIGFQQRIDRRFQSIDQLVAALHAVNVQSIDPVDASEELDRLREMLASADARDDTELQERMLQASRAFLKKIQGGLSTVGCSVGGNGPNVGPNGRTVDLHFFAQSINPHPKVEYTHEIRATQDGFVAEYRVEDADAVEYYRGPLADGESLREAAESGAGAVLRSVARLLNYKLTRERRRRALAASGEAHDPTVTNAGYEDEYPVGLCFKVHGSFFGGAPPVQATQDVTLEIILKNNAGATLENFQLDVFFPLLFSPRSEQRYVVATTEDQIRYQVRSSHHGNEKMLPGSLVKAIRIQYSVTAMVFQDEAARKKHVFFTVRSGESRYTKSIPVVDLCFPSPDELRALSQPVAGSP